MKILSSILLISLLTACSGNSTKNNTNQAEQMENKFLELPNCRKTKISSSDFKRYEGRIKNEPASYIKAAHCYFSFNQLETARLFYQKASQTNQAQIKYQSSIGEYEVYQKRNDIDNMTKLISKLKAEFPGQLMVWVYASKLYLDHYDLPRAEKAVASLSRFRDKSYFKLYSAYLQLLKDNKKEALKKWQSLNADNFANTPQAAFTASYLGYLLNDKIKAKEFLLDDLKQYDKDTYNQLETLLR